MSATTELPIESIEAFAARLPAPRTVDVSIEVVGEEIGDQIQVQRLPWHALVYDEAARILELSVGARGRGLPVVFRHEIHRPMKVWFEEDAGMITTLSIEPEEGPRTLVRFYERPALESS